MAQQRARWLKGSVSHSYRGYNRHFMYLLSKLIENRNDGAMLKGLVVCGVMI
jgi:hypothetical protein